MAKMNRKALLKPFTPGELEATRTKLAQLQRTLGLAVGALDGPDPQASFGYLAALDEHLQAAFVARGAR